MVYHPHTTNTVAWETHCGSYWSVVFTFECLEPEKWMDASLLAAPDRPHTVARCPGALDAVCLMYTNTKYTKEAMFPHTGTWTLNEYIMAGGQCTSDNLPPRIGQIQYAWRSPTLDIQERIYQVLERNARHAAEVTGCIVTPRWVTKTRVGLPNLALAELTYRNLQQVGAPVMNDAARDFARAIQENLGLSPMDEPFTADNLRLQAPQDYEAAQQRSLPPWQRNFTSDDYVEYTWHAPTARLHTSRPRLRPPEPGYTYPMWTLNAHGRRKGLHRPRHVRGGKDHRRHPYRPADQSRRTGKGTGRIQGTDRRRHRRRPVGRPAAARRLPTPGGLALARVHRHATGPGVVDSHPGCIRVCAKSL